MNLGWHSEFFEFLQHCSCQMLSKENTGQKLYSPYPEGNQSHLAQFAMSCLSNVHFPPTTRNLFHYTPRGHPQMTSSFFGGSGGSNVEAKFVYYFRDKPTFCPKISFVIRLSNLGVLILTDCSFPFLTSFLKLQIGC